MQFNSIVENLCKIRQYTSPLEIVLLPKAPEPERNRKLGDFAIAQEIKILSANSPSGETIFFEFVEVFDQESYLNIMTRHISAPHPFKIVIFFIKQKKMKIQPHSYVEYLNLDVVSILLQGHKYIPQFFKLSHAERLEMDIRFSKILPLQLASDPISKLHDFREGDIIKIVRKDGSLYYRRICVAD